VRGWRAMMLDDRATLLERCLKIGCYGLFQLGAGI
jgi:hypothetical protein